MLQTRTLRGSCNILRTFESVFLEQVLFEPLDWDTFQPSLYNFILVQGFGSICPLSNQLEAFLGQDHICYQRNQHIQRKQPNDRKRRNQRKCLISATSATSAASAASVISVHSIVSVPSASEVQHVVRSNKSRSAISGAALAQRIFRGGSFLCVQAGCSWLVWTSSLSHVDAQEPASGRVVRS